MDSSRTSLPGGSIFRTIGPGAVIFTLLALSTGLMVSRYVRLLPPTGSEEARLIDSLFQSMLGIAAVVFLLVAGALVYVLVRFRRRPGHEGEGIPIRGNNRLELAWTFMPALIVIWLAAYSSQVLLRIHAHRADPLVVQVTARQFVWQFEYPEFDISSPELHVPTGRPVQLELVAQDVIHSLWVPAFRLKQDALPHTPTMLSFTATLPGEFPIACAELCGAGHSVMRTKVVVHTAEEFSRWLEQQG